MVIFESILIGIKLIGQISVDEPLWSKLLSSPVIAGGAVIVAAILGGKYSIKLYNKKKDDQKVQIYRQLTIKAGILMDLYIIMINHYIYAEKLRLGLELDKCNLSMRGTDKIAVDKCINELSNFALYKDAKSRTEDIKIEVIRANGQFWTYINKNLGSFQDKMSLEQRMKLNSMSKAIRDAMEELVSYKFKSFGFDNELEKDMEDYQKTSNKKAPLEWLREEDNKMNAMHKEDEKELDKLIKDLRSKIEGLNNLLAPYADALIK